MLTLVDFSKYFWYCYDNKINYHFFDSPEWEQHYQQIKDKL